MISQQSNRVSSAWKYAQWTAQDPRKQKSGPTRAVFIATWMLFVSAVPDADERTSSGTVITSNLGAQYLGSDNISNWDPNLIASGITSKRHLDE